MVFDGGEERKSTFHFVNQTRKETNSKTINEWFHVLFVETIAFRDVIGQNEIVHILSELSLL